MGRSKLEKLTAKKASKKPDASDNVDDLLQGIVLDLDKAAVSVNSPFETSKEPGRKSNPARQSTNIRFESDAARPTSLHADGLHHTLRFLQYYRRYDRRKEKATGLRLKLEYEKAKLKDRERWLAESFDEVYHEMHEAALEIATASVIAAPQISFERVKTAMDRSRSDQEEVQAQERRCLKHEESVKLAEGRLQQVVESMMVSARKTIEHGGVYPPDSDDLISRSTEEDTVPSVAHTKPTMPPIVEKYFERLGEKNIMFERLAELEWERREELMRREIMQDQQDELGAEATEDYKLADENYERELRAGNMDYDKAVADFELVQKQCEDEHIDPYVWRLNDEDEDVSDRDDPHELAPPLRQASETLARTMSTLGHSLIHGVTIGPDPSDPHGLMATEVHLPGANGVPLTAENAHLSAKSVESWMKDLPEHDHKRVFDDDTPPATAFSRPRSKQDSEIPQTHANQAGHAVSAETVKIETNPTLQGQQTQGSDEDCMDNMMPRPSQDPEDTAAETSTRTNGAGIRTVGNFAGEQHMGSSDAPNPSSRRSTGKSSGPQTEGGKAVIMEKVIEDLTASLQLIPAPAQTNEQKLESSISVSQQQILETEGGQATAAAAAYIVTLSAQLTLPEGQPANGDASTGVRATSNDDSSSQKLSTVHWAQDLIDEHPLSSSSPSAPKEEPLKDR